MRLAVPSSVTNLNGAIRTPITGVRLLIFIP